MENSNGKHAHGEAFMIMEYRCQACGAGEAIWNSRDGVTPFIVGCKVCGGESRHLDWKRDLYRPNHRPVGNDRVFVDLTEELAREHAEAVHQRAVDSDYPPPADMTKDEFVEMILRGMMERSGEPDLVEYNQTAAFKERQEGLLRSANNCASCGESEAVWPEPQMIGGVKNTQIYCIPCTAVAMTDNPFLTPRQRRRVKKRVLQGKVR